MITYDNKSLGGLYTGRGLVHNWDASNAFSYRRNDILIYNTLPISSSQYILNGSRTTADNVPVFYYNSALPVTPYQVMQSISDRTTFTVEVWFKITATGVSDIRYYHQGFYNDPSGKTFGLMIQDSWGYGGGNLYGYWTFRTSTTGDGYDDDSYGTTPGGSLPFLMSTKLNKWFCMIGRFDSGSKKMWINTTNNLSWVTNTSTQARSYTGLNAIGNTLQFDTYKYCKINCARIYNVALTDTEIQTNIKAFMGRMAYYNVPIASIG